MSKNFLFSCGACAATGAPCGRRVLCFHRTPRKLSSRRPPRAALCHPVILRLHGKLLCEFAEGRADARIGIRDSMAHIDRATARIATIVRIGATENGTEARGDTATILEIVSLVGALTAANFGRPHLQIVSAHFLYVGAGAGRRCRFQRHAGC